MKQSFINKLNNIVQRHEELAHQLSQPEVTNDLNRFRELSKEYAELNQSVALHQRYQTCLATLANAEALLQDEDAELRAMAVEELNSAKIECEEIEKQVQLLLLPQDPNDKRNVFLEIRGAAGGDESAIFAGDLFRMYTRYAERRGWNVEIISESAGEHGGYKEIVARIFGESVYARLKFESGAHRVQRVPDTEAQGRIHTSTCTVAILPEADTIDEFKINPADLRIDTFRSSGAGGQHVQKTDSAIRITHIPTGTVIECQDERSQHKNRARAMSLLQARLLAAQRSKQQQEEAATRRNLVGTGDRSERIRTYNFPQSRLTDHRINLTLYKLAYIMEGDLDEVIDPLIQEDQADRLGALKED